MELSEVVKSNQLQQKPTGGALTGFTEAFTVKGQQKGAGVHVPTKLINCAHGRITDNTIKHNITPFITVLACLSKRNTEEHKYESPKACIFKMTFKYFWLTWQRR